MAFSFLHFLRVLLTLAIPAFLFLSFSTVALGVILPTDESQVEMYEALLDKSDYDTLGLEATMPSGCELVVTIVDSYDYSKHYQVVFAGEGDTIKESRTSVFEAYGHYVETGGLWHSRYNHGIIFRDCT